MTYVDLINSFWRIRLDLELDASDIGLFFAVVSEINRSRTKNNLIGSRAQIGNPKLEILSGLSRTEIWRKRNKLKQAGLIDFSNGKGKKSYAIYFLGKLFQTETVNKKVFHAETVNETESETVNGTVPETVNETRYKSKELRDKKKENTIKEKFPYQELVDLYNNICTSLPKVKVLTDERKTLIKKRWEKKLYDSLEKWEKVFIEAEKTPFLKGDSIPKNGRKPWVANFDWLIKNDTNPTRVLERVYDGDQPQNFQQSKKDTSDLVRGHDYGTDYNIDDNALLEEVLDNEQGTSGSTDTGIEQKSFAWQKPSER